MKEFFFFAKIMASHPSPLNRLPSSPPPILYCISQAFPIMGFIPRPVTSGGRPAPLPTMAPWGLRQLRCCKASTPRPPATLPCSTFTARISLRAQVCMARFCTSPLLPLPLVFFFFLVSSPLFLVLLWFFYLSVISCTSKAPCLLFWWSLKKEINVLQYMNTCIWSFALRCTACSILFLFKV